jgi:hypothetical protein
MKLRYKCRRCEKVFYAGEDMPQKEAWDELLRALVAGGSSNLMTIHPCDGERESTKAFGLADLQGAS